MKIGYYQYAPEFHDPETTLKRIERALTGVEADLIVLPELALSGYLFADRQETAACAEPVPGPVSDRFSRLAADSGCAFVYGCIEQDGADNLYNSSVFISPDGTIHVYRKAHLFNREKLLFTPGDSGFFTFSFRGAAIGMLVCFDHLFPEAARTLALSGAQIICHPSNLVLPGTAQITTRSRSIENRVYWILANRTGSETSGPVSCTYTGKSQITGPDGSVLTSSSEEDEELVVIEVDPAAAHDKFISKRNHVLKDRRPELYTGISLPYREVQ
jgi:predicted amidohydrolase